jgi:hypothetical protein
MISFVCDHCHAELQIGQEWAGKLGHCPHYGTDSRVPGYPKRTSKLTILARIAILPLLAAGSVAALLGWEVFLGGVIAVAGALFFCWAFTNIGTYLCSPRYYRMWKAGGGDPWFDTLDPPLNNDPPEVRYQEMYREKARQECEEVDRVFGIPPPARVAPDTTQSIDDPNVI